MDFFSLEVRFLFVIVRFLYVFLLVMLTAGCTLQTATTTPTAIPTITPQVLETATLPPPTGTLLVLPTATTPPDLIANLQVVMTAIEMGQPEMLRSLIGEEGVVVDGFAQGEGFKGYNNADEIVAAFAEALDQSKPICEGFVPYIGALPDKAILVYRGIEFDWNRFDLSGTSAGGMTIQLFRLPEGWRLVGITPFDFEWGLPILGPLQDCPS